MASSEGGQNRISKTCFCLYFMKGTRSFCAKCQEASFKEELGEKVDSKITLQSQKYNKYQRKGKKKELRPTTRLFAAVGSLCGPSGSKCEAV